MNRKAILISTFRPIIKILMTALGGCFVCIFFSCKPVQTVELPPPTTPFLSPTPVSDGPIPNREIKSTEVTSLAIEPFFTDFYEKDSKCGRSYNEVYGKEDGFYSPAPPCMVKITFNRDGTAGKSMEIFRYDKATKQRKILESFNWTAKITETQFNALSETVVSNSIFRNWTDGVSVTVSNCNISVKHGSGIRTLMGNVDKSTTDFWVMINVFKKLDGEVKWEKSQ